MPSFNLQYNYIAECAPCVTLERPRPAGYPYGHYGRVWADFDYGCNAVGLTSPA
jgi:hypothetical protein